MHPWEELFEASLNIQENADQNIPEEIPPSKGIVLFADRENRPIQLLCGANMRKLITARIRKHTDESLTKRSDVLQVARQVYYRQTPNDFRMRLAYHQAARACFQDAWKDWIHLPRQVFASICEESPCPCFQVLEKPKFHTDKGQILYGLFPGRKAADHFCEVLNTVYGLCRNPSLAGSDKAKICTYLQMDLCSGYCEGKISKQTYLDQVRKAISCSAGGKPASCIDILAPEMKRLGKLREYEKAQKIKEKIDLLKSLDTPACQWTGALQNLSILHIDRSKKIQVDGKKKKLQTWDLFRITWNAVYARQEVLWENLQSACEKVLLEPDWKIEYKPDEVSEHLAAVCWFVYGKNRDGLWINDSDRNSNAETLLARMQETFPAPRQHTKQKKGR